MASDKINGEHLGSPPLSQRIPIARLELSSKNGTPVKDELDGEYPPRKYSCGRDQIFFVSPSINRKPPICFPLDFGFEPQIKIRKVR